MGEEYVDLITKIFPLAVAETGLASTTEHIAQTTKLAEALENFFKLVNKKWSPLGATKVLGGKVSKGATDKSQTFKDAVKPQFTSFINTLLFFLRYKDAAETIPVLNWKKSYSRIRSMKANIDDIKVSVDIPTALQVEKMLQERNQSRDELKKKF